MWYALNQWLQSFAYRVSLGWMMFFLTLVAALFLALITVSW
jgi:putative ABC transport system permease protein